MLISLLFVNMIFLNFQGLFTTAFFSFSVNISILTLNAIMFLLSDLDPFTFKDINQVSVNNFHIIWLVFHIF